MFDLVDLVDPSFYKRAGRRQLVRMPLFSKEGEPRPLGIFYIFRPASPLFQ